MAKPTPTPVGVTTPANAGASNKSAPAPTPAVPAGFKKWLLLAFITLVVVICIVLIASVAHSPKQPSRPQVSAVTQQKEGAPLPMSAYGDSQRYTAREGNVMEFYGKGFTSHCVYKDGSEEKHEDGDKSHCSRSDISYQFARDTTGHSNSVTFESVPR